MQHVGLSRSFQRATRVATDIHILEEQNLGDMGSLTCCGSLDTKVSNLMCCVLDGG